MWHLNVEDPFLKIPVDGTGCVLSRCQVSLNLGRLIDLAKFFNETYMNNILQMSQEESCVQMFILRHSVSQ